MRIGWLAMLALVLACEAATAAPRRHPPPRCVDRPSTFSLQSLFFGPPPAPNGCAPAVYEYGHFIGQDPDPFIRQQLRRDPATGSLELVR